MITEVVVNAVDLILSEQSRQLLAQLCAARTEADGKYQARAYCQRQLGGAQLWQLPADEAESWPNGFSTITRFQPVCNTQPQPPPLREAGDCSELEANRLDGSPCS